MIAYIQGKLIEKTPTTLVVDVNGIGYQIHISLNTYTNLPNTAVIKLHTYLQIKEDAHTLYGFIDQSERELFTLLLSVSGIGASTARNMLSYIQPKELMQAIVNEDVKTIQSIKGIGLKTAQRTIIELREKVMKMSDDFHVQSPSVSVQAEEALAALEVLGFDKKRADKVVKTFVSEHTDATVEEIIKFALKTI